MRGGRVYLTSRRAYFPRLWPMWCASVPLVVPSVLIVNNVWFAVAYGATVALLVGHVRLWWWRRRHPIITLEEYVADMARWN